MALVNIGGRNFHVKLTDRAGTSVGINLVDASGNDNALEISQSNHPRTPLQTSQGQGEYSDLLLPYKELVQQDWSGGRASKDFRKDQTRYLDAGGLDTELDEQVVLRGKHTYTTGMHTISQSLPGDVTWQALTGSEMWRSVAFTVDTTIAATDVQFTVWLRKIGTPNADVTIAAYTDAAGDPSGSVNSYSIIIGHCEADIMEVWSCTEGAGTWLVGAQQYHFVAKGHSSDNDANHWEIACVKGSSSGQSSTTGSSWVAGPAPYYRVFDNSNESKGEFFTYKSALYFIEKPNSGNSRLLINGDRGAADSNAGLLGRTIDSLKSWTDNEFVGATVLIIGGTGSEEAQPWREITSNKATYVVGADWEIQHDTTTEYVIIGADTWRVHATITSPIRDVAVAGEYAFMCNRSAGIHRYNERNLAGVWTIVSNATENLIYADMIKTIPHPTDGVILWGAYNNHFIHKESVFNAVVPPAWSITGLYEKVSVLDEIDRLWDESYTAAATMVLTRDRRTMKMAIAAGFVTGILATKKLATPVDVTQGESIGFTIRSSVALDSSDLSLLLDDTPYCGKKYIPDYLYHYDTQGRPTLFYYDDSETDADKWKQQGNTNKRRDSGIYRVNFTLAAADKVYIGFAQRFDRAKWDISTAQTTAQTMTAEFWNGAAWEAVTGFVDGTLNGGDTLGQDGDMTWTINNDWNPGTHGDQATYLSQSLYWVRLTPAAVLTNAKGEVTIEDGEVAVYTNLSRAKDGDTGTQEIVSLNSDDYIYVGSDFRFERIYVNMGAVPNAITPATLACEYFNGEKWDTVAVADDATINGGATLAVDGIIQIGTQHHDWHKLSIEENEAYWLRLKPSVDLTPYITIIEIAAQSDNAESLGLPAINANETTFVQLSSTFFANPIPPTDAVRSIGFKLNTDKGAQTLNISGPMMVCRSPGYIDIGNKITGLGIHGDERTNLIVHTESGAVEIQSENNNAVVPLPLDELKTLRSTINGRATCHNDVYHYFNLHKYVQRYVDGSLENIGPDEDEGLPSERAGLPSNLLSHPNRVLLTLDASNITLGISTVHARRGGGWHDVYRSPKVNDTASGFFSDPIEHIAYQSSYNNIDRLWIAHGGDLLWVPITLDNPANNDLFYYQPSGYLVTGWMDANFVDIEKTFTHMKLATENLSSGAITIDAQYQLDTGLLENFSDPTHWTDISAQFNTSPSQRRELSTTADVTAKRIRFRFIFDTNDETITPILKSSVLQLIFMHPIKEVVSMRYRSNDVGVSVDGQPDYTSTAVAFDATIKGWASPPANILTLNCQHPSFDGKTVVAQYPSGKPLESDPEGGPEEETLIRELVLMEI